MKCQKCDKQAVFHITELEAGEVRELHLCEDHARAYLNQAETPADGESEPQESTSAGGALMGPLGVGQTADELFGGYPWRYYRSVTSLTREEYLRQYYDYWQRLVPDEDRKHFFNEETWAQVKEYEPFDKFRGRRAPRAHPLPGTLSSRIL